MKKSFFILVAAVLLFGCQKKEIVGPALPHYDETNTEALTWDQLPDELKNAKPLPKDLSDPKLSSYSYSVGPWGGSGGYYFSCLPANNNQIYAMAIQAGSRIDRMVVWYKINNTVYVGMDEGGTGGTYYLQYFTDDEYINRVSGRYGTAYNRITIHQLSFTTNYKTFTYGGNTGTAFSISTLPSDYQILGFYGRSGDEIDQIGFYVYTRY